MDGRRWVLLLAALVCVCVVGGPANPAGAEAVIGEAAPQFSLPDAEGTARSLGEFSDQYVVLEWFNPECPFVRKHYGSGNMQALQRTYTDAGVAWLTIDSSAPGKQGHLTPTQAKATSGQEGMASTALLLDPTGEVGRLYGAKTTPHMFIIDPAGTLVYAGAIDDTPSTDPADIARSTNFVSLVLDNVLAGATAPTFSNTSYGCSVKY